MKKVSGNLVFDAFIEFLGLCLKIMMWLAYTILKAVNAFLELLDGLFRQILK